MKLITDKRMTNGLVNPEFFKLLKTPIQSSTITQSESDELNKILLDGIKKYPALGISANQLGINKRVCLILNTLSPIKEESDYLFLVNPIFSKKSEEYFVFLESCISIHNSIKKPIRTYRHNEVTIKTDNLGELTFKINPDGDVKAPAPWKVSLETLQTVLIQHEIDHLDGITIKERNTSNPLIKSSYSTYGRNEKVVMKSPTGDLIDVKFKKANEYFLKGYELV